MSLRDMRELMLDITRYNAGVRRARRAYYAETAENCPRGHRRSPNGGHCLQCAKEDKE